jgi:hypothetical protein
MSTSDSKLLEFEILENSSIFYQILASTRVLELKKLKISVTEVKRGYNDYSSFKPVLALTPPAGIVVHEPARVPRLVESYALILPV